MVTTCRSAFVNDGTNAICSLIMLLLVSSFFKSLDDNVVAADDGEDEDKDEDDDDGGGVNFLRISSLSSVSEAFGGIPSSVII